MDAAPAPRGLGVSGQRPVAASFPATRPDRLLHVQAHVKTTTALVPSERRRSSSPQPLTSRPQYTTKMANRQTGIPRKTGKARAWSPGVAGARPGRHGTPLRLPQCIRARPGPPPRKAGALPLPRNNYLRRRRREATSPAPPRPSRSSVAGSGVITSDRSIVCPSKRCPMG